MATQQGILVDTTIDYCPSEYGFHSNLYTDVQELYRVNLSPTIITLTSNNETSERVIKKQI